MSLTSTIMDNENPFTTPPVPESRLSVSLRAKSSRNPFAGFGDAQRPGMSFECPGAGCPSQAVGSHLERSIRLDRGVDRARVDRAARHGRLGTEVGAWYYTHQNMQGAPDMAALSAANAYATQSSSSGLL